MTAQSSPTSNLSLMLRPITSSSAAQSIRALTHDMELIRAEMITRIGEKARERDALIDTLIARGWGLKRIADETGLSKGRVVQIRDRYGRTPPPPIESTVERNQEIARDHALLGMTYAELGRKYSISRQRVRSIVEREEEAMKRISADEKMAAFLFRNDGQGKPHENSPAHIRARKMGWVKTNPKWSELTQTTEAGYAELQRLNRVLDEREG